jgi:hypothetical protein
MDGRIVGQPLPVANLTKRQATRLPYNSNCLSKIRAHLPNLWTTWRRGIEDRPDVTDANRSVESKFCLTLYRAHDRVRLTIR